MEGNITFQCQGNHCEERIRMKNIKIFSNLNFQTGILNGNFNAFLIQIRRLITRKNRFSDNDFGNSRKNFPTTASES